MAYDLAFFQNPEVTISNVSNYVNIFLLKKLYDSGIKKFNCGSSLNANLKKFKCHYPSNEKISYKYSQVKIVQNTKLSSFLVT